MLAKILAGLVMGAVAAALCRLLAGVGGGGGTTGSWTALAGFLVVLVLAITAARGRDAWGRGLLISGLLCLAMALSAIVYGDIFGGGEVGSQATDAGGATVTAMAGSVLTLTSAVLGLVLGPTFLIGSYVALRRG